MMAADPTQMRAADEDMLSLQVDSTSSAAESSVTPAQGWTTDKFEVSGLSVEVHTNPSKNALGLPVLTFHDIAQNSSTFIPLFAHSLRASIELDASVAHYHITAPGHQPRAPDAPADVDYSLPAMSKAILRVLDRFTLARVVAIGVGAGANAFLRAASERPSAFAGLILISPVLHASHIGERVAGSVGGVLSRGLGLAVSHHMKEALLARWLSAETREHSGSVTPFEDQLDKLNPRNIARYIAAESWRDGVAGLIGKIDSKVLFITGKESSLRHHTADLYPSFNPAQATWLDIRDCGTLVHEEMPDRVVEAVKLFLQGLPGYFDSMS